MTHKILTFSFLIAFILMSCSQPRIDLLPDEDTIRETQQGILIGGDNGKTHQWLGIPYGDIPSSEYRWKEAKAPQIWVGVREALKFGSFCVQKGSLVGTTQRKDWDKIIGSENCLNLNIWAPKLTPEAIGSEIANYPVMLWIHGGSNMAGNSDFYNPTELVLQHKVVVVTINYRLGPFGWFRHPSILAESNNGEDRSGNYGNLDTIQALRWVQKNILNFGGDPDNVTIFGESAGGYNVAALLSSPLAQGLFHKAISQSGGIKPGDIDHSENYLSNPLPWKNYSSKELFNQLLILKQRAANRADATAIQKGLSTEEISDVLRSASTVEIFEAYLQAKVSTNDMLRPFPDGHVLHEDGIIASLQQGIAPGVPIIFGTNRDENKLFLIGNPRFVRTFFGLPRSRDKELYEAIAKHRSNTWKLLAVDQPARELVQSGQSNIYAYRFDWDEEPRRLGTDISHLLGAAHSFEIPFVMGNLDKNLMTRYMIGSKNLVSVTQLSNAMMSYWAEFAYSGRPGRGRSRNLPLWNEWSESSADSPKFIIFDTVADNGIRMSSDSLTKSGLMAAIAIDPEIIDFKDKCELVDTAIQYDDLMEPSYLKEFDEGLCSNLDPEDWRRYWYENMEHIGE